MFHSDDFSLGQEGLLVDAVKALMNASTFTSAALLKVATKIRLSTELRLATKCV
jgi:hypothetical protein